MIRITRDGIIIQPCTTKGYLPWKASYNKDEHATYAETPQAAAQALREWKARDWVD